MTKSFKGGIQHGTTAFDEASHKLDTDAKLIRDELANEFENLEMIKVISKKLKIELTGDDCWSFAPDGGSWFKNGKLVAAIECKKQNTAGNACERWWDNATTAKHLNKDVIYITFCTGAGAAPGECLDKLRRKSKMMMGENYKFFMCADGFDYQTMKSIIVAELSEL